VACAGLSSVLPSYLPERRTIVIIKKSEFEALQAENGKLCGKVADLEELVTVQRIRIENLEACLKDVKKAQEDKYTVLLEKYIALMERTVGNEQGKT
jgi:hypothetical protein